MTRLANRIHGWTVVVHKRGDPFLAHYSTPISTAVFHRHREAVAYKRELQPHLPKTRLEVARCVVTITATLKPAGRRAQ